MQGLGLHVFWYCMAGLFPAADILRCRGFRGEVHAASAQGQAMTALFETCARGLSSDAAWKLLCGSNSQVVNWGYMLHGPAWRPCRLYPVCMQKPC